MLPLRPPAGKPASLVCTYAATGHNSAVLSLDVTEDLMFTGSKGWCHNNVSATGGSESNRSPSEFCCLRVLFEPAVFVRDFSW